MLLCLENSCYYILSERGELWEDNFSEDVRIVDDIFDMLLHLLFEGLLVGLALEFISFLED